MQGKLVRGLAQETWDKRAGNAQKHFYRFFAAGSAHRSSATQGAKFACIFKAFRSVPKAVKI